MNIIGNGDFLKLDRIASDIDPLLPVIKQLVLSSLKLKIDQRRVRKELHKI